jgi:hypothetical protein
MDAVAQLFAALVVSLTSASIAVMVGLLCWDAIADANRMGLTYGLPKSQRAAAKAGTAAQAKDWSTPAAAV